jgi:hypothetical protein
MGRTRFIVTALALVLWLAIRNGYNPIYAIYSLLCLWMFGFIAFGARYQTHVILPTDKDAYAELTSKGMVPVSNEPFCALTYAIDSSLPIISFGQRDKWHVAFPEKAIGVAKTDSHGVIYHVLCQATFTRGWFEQAPCGAAATVASVLNLFRWLYLAAGWFLTTMFVAGITGLVGRD